MMLGDVWVSAEMIPHLCKITKRDRRTVTRWLKKRELPHNAHALLNILQNGNLSRIHENWTGWMIDPKSGALVTPVRTKVYPGELLAIPYRLHLHTTYQRKIKHLETQIATEGRKTSDSGIFQI